MKIGIFGAGFSGRMIGALAAENGATVWGTTRKVENFSSLRTLGIEPRIFEGQAPASDLSESLSQTTHLIISIAPPRAETGNEPDSPVDPVLRALEKKSLLEMAPMLEWVGYLSTVGVYGNHEGAWVNETAEVSPVSERARQRVRAETEWLELGKAHDLPVGVFRLSGIYGPGRNALVTANNGQARRLVKTSQVFNRIHVSDIAQALWLAAQKRADGLFNITDDEPAPPQDVVTHAHELMGRTPPPEMDFETAELTPMARSFYGENKRVSNAKSKEILGLNYDFPNYRVALQRMWEEDNWKGEI